MPGHQWCWGLKVFFLLTQEPNCYPPLPLCCPGHTFSSAVLGDPQYKSPSIFFDVVYSLFLLTIAGAPHSFSSLWAPVCGCPHLILKNSPRCFVPWVPTQLLFIWKWLDNAFVLIWNGCFSLAAELCTGRSGCFFGISACQPHLWCLKISAVWMGNPLSPVSVVPCVKLCCLCLQCLPVFVF